MQGRIQQSELEVLLYSHRLVLDLINKLTDSAAAARSKRFEERQRWRSVVDGKFSD